MWGEARRAGPCVWFCGDHHPFTTGARGVSVDPSFDCARKHDTCVCTCINPSGEARTERAEPDKKKTEPKAAKKVYLHMHLFLSFFSFGLLFFHRAASFIHARTDQRPFLLFPLSPLHQRGAHILGPLSRPIPIVHATFRLASLFPFLSAAPSHPPTPPRIVWPSRLFVSIPTPHFCYVRPHESQPPCATQI